MNRIPNWALWLGVACLGAALFGGVRLVRTSQAAAAQAQADVQRVSGHLDEMRSDLESLHAAKAGATPERVVVVQAPSASVSPALAAIPSEPPPEDPEAHEFLQQQQMRETAQRLDEKLAAEARDASWSSQMENAVRSSVGSAAPHGRVMSAECKTSFCKVVLSHATLADRDETPTALATDGPFRTGVYYYRGDPNDPTLTLYVVREGHLLAELGI